MLVTEEIKVGTRIRLLSMNWIVRPPNGATGVVTYLQPMSLGRQGLWVTWDEPNEKCRTSVILPDDKIEVLP